MESREESGLQRIRADVGVVADERTILDADRMPREYVYLTSEVLKVVSEPPPPRSDTPAQNGPRGPSWRRLPPGSARAQSGLSVDGS